MPEKTINKAISELLKKKNFLEKETAEQLAKIEELEKEREKREQDLNRFLAEKKESEEKKAFKESLEKELNKIIEQEEELDEKIRDIEAMREEEKDPQKSEELRWNRWQAGKQRRDISAKKQDLEEEIEKIKNQVKEVEEKENNLPKFLEGISNSIAEEKRKLEAKTREMEEIEREIAEEKKKGEERQREEEKRRQEEKERNAQEALERQRQEEKSRQEEEQKRKEEEKRKKEREEEERKAQEIRESARIKQEEERRKKEEEKKKKEGLSNLLNQAISLYNQKKFKESLVEFKTIIQEAEKIELEPGFLATAFGKKTTLAQARKYAVVTEKALKRQEQAEAEKQKQAELKRQQEGQRQEQEKRAREEFARKKQEEIERQKQEGMEKQKREEERKKKEEEERRGVAEEEKRKQEEVRRKEEEKRRKEREEEERIAQEIRKRAKIQPKEEKKKKKEAKPEKTLKDKWKERLEKIKQAEVWNELTSFTRYPVVGIDISDRSIEILNLDQQGKLLAYGRSVLEEGIVQDGTVINQKKLTDILKETFKNAKPRSLTLEPGLEMRAVVSLPESKTYIQHFVFKDRSNLYQKIQKKVQETVPILFRDLYFNFLQIGNSKEEIRVLCVAAKQEIIGNYIYLLRVAGITPIVLDTESASIARALLPGVYGPFKKKEEVAGENTMILDIGARTAILGVHSKEGVMSLAVSIPYAGTYFTKKVAESFNISFQEAEGKKINQGFKEGSEVLPVLEKASQKLINEAKEAAKFYEKEFGEKITKIILAGGSALLPEIDRFFQNYFEAKVEIGNPLLKIKAGEELDRKKGVLYSNVIGLALRGISRDPVESGVNLLPEEIKTKERRIQQERQKSVLFGAVLFALAGLSLLAASIFYLIFLPVPVEMIHLKQRILLMLPEEKKEMIMVRVAEEFVDTEVPILAEPDEEAEIVVMVIAGDMLELIEEQENWLKVRIKAEEKEGWIKVDYIDIIR